MRFQQWSVFMGYLMSTMFGFGGLRDLKDNRFSELVSFFCYKISKTVGFGGLQDLSDVRFWWVTQSQRRSVLLGNKRSQ